MVKLGLFWKEKEKKTVISFIDFRLGGRFFQIQAANDDGRRRRDPQFLQCSLLHSVLVFCLAF